MVICYGSPRKLSQSVWGTVIKNATDWVVYKSQKFTSHISGGWEVQDQALVTAFGVWRGLLPQEYMSSQYKLTRQKEGGLSRFSIIRAKTKFMRAPIYVMG